MDGYIARFLFEAFYKLPHSLVIPCTKRGRSIRRYENVSLHSFAKSTKVTSIVKQYIEKYSEKYIIGI